MKKHFFTETEKEYQEFLTSQGTEPPKHLAEKIFERVRTDLNPSAWAVFGKMALIHFASGLVTLSICPQFGVRFAGEGLGIMKWFSYFGSYGCMAACGAFFIGISLLISGLVLRPEEVRKLRKRKWLQISAVVFLSLGALIMADAEIVLGFGLAWVIGSIAGGVAALELSWHLKVARLAST